MMETCENCRHNADELCKGNECHWEADYPTLESQLAKANELIKEQIGEICGLREEKRHLMIALKRAIQGYKNLIELKLIPERYFADTDGYIREYESVLALCRPAPVDEEKAVLKMAIKLASAYIVDKRLDFPATAEEWGKEFINQARSRIAEGEKK
jgi:hypothetical protein